MTSTPSLTREYAKRNEWVIGIDAIFTHSPTHSLDPSLRCKLCDVMLCYEYILQQEQHESSDNND